MLGRLMPREGKFFDLFNAHAERIVEGARELAAMIGTFKELDAHAQRIDAVERAADKITHECMTLLHKTFITPFDRDQIHQLISRMDDILDLIDAVADRLLIYKIKNPTDGCLAMAKIIVKTTEETDRAVRCLRTLSPLYQKHSIEVNRLENEADRLLRDELAALFEGGTDAIEVIKWKELYETMEAVTDRCEDVLNVIEGITLKMA